MVEKADSATALMPLWCQTDWYWVFVLVRDGFDDGKDFAGDVAFEATDGVSLTFAVFGSFF